MMNPGRTVLVLGAGASWPYGLPTGPELRRKICDSFPEQAGRLAEGDPLWRPFASQADEFVKRLLASDLPSIDAFLRCNEGLEPVGKLAIALSILEHESKDALVNPKDDHWYQYFWQRLGKPDVGSVVDRMPRFVTFNYDRSLEQYLLDRVRALYDLDEQTAAWHLRHLPLVHVYGRSGRLPWQEGADEPIGYGNWDSERRTASSAVIRASQNMRIVGAEAREEIKIARKWLSVARVIGFLGFGYMGDNLSLLFNELCFDGGVIIEGSACHLTPADAEQAAKRIHSAVVQPPGWATPPPGEGQIRQLAARSWRFAIPRGSTPKVTNHFGNSAHKNLEFLRNCRHLLRP